MHQKKKIHHLVTHNLAVVDEDHNISFHKKIISTRFYLLYIHRQKFQKMVLNYHELTMTESRDSPARRQQFLVICSIMSSWFLYSLYISGLLVRIETVEMPFPGGNFCYKFVARDYVASMGLGRRIRKHVYDLLPEDVYDDDDKKLTNKEKRNIAEERVYHMFLDNPEIIGGAHTRWMTGVLVPDGIEKEKYCDPLFDHNPEIERQALIHIDEPETDKKAGDVFDQTVYKYVNLPSVNSLAVRFPFTNGFLSGLVFSYKVCFLSFLSFIFFLLDCFSYFFSRVFCIISREYSFLTSHFYFIISIFLSFLQIIPEMRILAKEKGEAGNVPVIISQCSEGDGYCTHYVPLVQGGDFLVGQPPMDKYLESIGEESFELFEILKNGARRIKKYFVTSETKTTTTTGDEEL
jgi:hypothetical protein